MPKGLSPLSEELQSAALRALLQPRDAQKDRRISWSVSFRVRSCECLLDALGFQLGSRRLRQARFSASWKVVLVALVLQIRHPFSPGFLGSVRCLGWRGISGFTEGSSKAEDGTTPTGAFCRAGELLSVPSSPLFLLLASSHSETTISCSTSTNDTKQKRRRRPCK